jgi:hypothetical protein
MLTVNGKKALIKVAEWLEQGAPHVDLNGRRIDRFDMEFAVTEMSCGTACCIAGAICQFENLGVIDEDGDMKFRGETGAGSLAQKLLGISYSEAGKLFEPWDHFTYDSFTQFSEVGVAAKTIRNFIETGVVHWDIESDDDDGY